MKMKITLLATLLFSFTTSQAQVANEDVHFNFYQSAGNNDLVNHFSGGLGLAQIQTNGITGGCLTTPDSISWGNDNAIYCSRYKPLTGDTTVTFLCFKYDSTLVHLSSYQRAMSIWLRPLADYNHYIIATVSADKKIELLTYGWSNNPYPLLALHSNHWYRYQLTVIFMAAQQQTIKAEVFDLGVTGTSIPALVNSSSGIITDNVLAADTSIQVSVTGASYGGSAYLDDFNFYGREGITDCINVVTGTSNDFSSGGIHIYPSPAKDEITIVSNEAPKEDLQIEIGNVVGEKVMSLHSSQQKITADVHLLPPGTYFITIFNEQGILGVKKFVKE